MTESIHPDSPALRTLRDQATAIRRRRISGRELLDEYLSRIERIDPSLNAVITIDAERAKVAAARADEVTARSEITALSNAPKPGDHQDVLASYYYGGLTCWCDASTRFLRQRRISE
jgi:hypothetical protein